MVYVVHCHLYMLYTMNFDQLPGTIVLWISMRGAASTCVVTICVVTICVAWWWCCFLGNKFYFTRPAGMSVTKHMTVTKVKPLQNLNVTKLYRYTFGCRLRDIRPLQNRYTIESFRDPPKKYFTDSYICVVETRWLCMQATPML